MRHLLRILAILFIVIPVFVTTAQDAEPPRYRVAEVIDLERMAGPAGTSAFLSPDGSRYAYFEPRSICLYSLPDNDEEACYAFNEEERIRPNVETVRWSRDGRYLAFQDIDALRVFIDSDIRLLDVEAGELRNLTDDGYEGRLVLNMDEFDEPVNVDIAVAWSDDNRLAVLRYPFEDPEQASATEMQIVIVDPETGETELVRDWSLQQAFLYYSIAWGGDTIAVGRVPSNRSSGGGVDLFNAETGQRDRVVRVSENLANIMSMQFSADGNYLLGYNPFYRAVFGGRLDEAEFDGLGVIQLSGGSDKRLNDDQFVIQAGFAPEGSAIAYIVQTRPGEEGGGLYIAPAPGEPGELILPMERLDGTTSLSQMHLTWAANNTIMLRNNENQTTLLVVLQQSG